MLMKRWRVHIVSKNSPLPQRLLSFYDWKDIIVQKLRWLIFLILILNICSKAQDAGWLINITKIQPLKSTEKDVEQLFGKPTLRYADVGEYLAEEGKLSITYSDGNCKENIDAEYDVEKGTVVEIDFSVRKKTEFKSLNINLAGFKKKYPADITNSVSYENKKRGISYEVSYGLLTFISIIPSKNYDYLKCPQKPESAVTITDDVNQEFLDKLSKLLPLQSTQADVANLFGKPYKSENEQLDFYLSQKYGMTFLYSTGKCSSLNDDIWNVSKGKIVGYGITFYLNGMPLPDLSKLTKIEDKAGFSIYENKEEGFKYKIKDGRLWAISFNPPIKYNGLRCTAQ
jgi:hypothetical protein